MNRLADSRSPYLLQHADNIDAWTQEQLAASPAWSKEKWDTIVAILEPDAPS